MGSIDAAEAPALPFEELAGRPGRVRLAEPLIGAVAAVVVGIAPPGLEHALLVVALELVRLAAVGTWAQRNSLQGALLKISLPTLIKLHSRQLFSSEPSWQS